MTNVVNVNKILHEKAVLNKQRFKVSPNAVKEYCSRIIDHIEDNTIQLCMLAKRNNRKTIMEDDVIELFSYIGMEVA